MDMLLFVSGLGLFSTVVSEVCYWQYDTFYSCDFVYPHVLETLPTTRSLIECCERCNENDECMSVKFHTISKTCELNSRRMVPGPVPDCPKTCRYATLSAGSCLKLTKKVCAVTIDCVVPNSLCVEEKCQCNHGYNYNPVNDNCVTSCDVYGSTFTQHLEYGIEGKTRKVLSDTSRGDCLKACLDETSFVCRTADYRLALQRCMLATTTALKSQDRYKQYAETDHYQRNCQ